MFERLITRLTFILFGIVIFMTLSNTVKADTALIMHSNYQDAHTNVKAQLEADGYTVTLSTDGAVPDNLINNYDVVFDLKYNNNIGSNGKDRYDDFVENGGVLVITGENHASYSNTNNTVRAFIQNKLSGTLTFQGTTGGGSCGNDCSMTQTNTSAGVSSYSNVGVYAYGAHFTGDGTWVVKSTSGKILWMKWSGSELPNGYTGEVYVTFDINQFTTTYDGADMDDLISELYSSSTTTYTSSISSTQQTTVTNTRNITSSGNSNAIYIDQVGDNLDLDIVQNDNSNLVAGTSTTSSTIADAVISGDDNTVSITQGNSAGSTSDNNVVLIGVDGDNNNLNIRQGDNVDDTGEARLTIDVTGDYNTIGTVQENDGMGVGDEGHFMSVDVDGNSNIMYMDQKDDSDKIMFVDVNGSSNDIDLVQQGTGEHFLDVTAGSNQTIDVNQDGSGNMSATIDMDGYSSTLDLDQTGSSNQTYSLDQNCTNVNGCGTTTITQN